MAYRTGRKLAVKMHVTGTSYAIVGGARSDAFTINSEPVDVTNKTSVNGSGTCFRELLAQGGVRSFDAEVEIVYNDSTITKLFMDRALANTLHTYRIEVAGDPTTGGGYYEGQFQIGNYGNSGSFNDAITGSYSLISAGDVTFTTGTI